MLAKIRNWVFVNQSCVPPNNGNIHRIKDDRMENSIIEADIGTLCVSREGEQGGTRRPPPPTPPPSPPPLYCLLHKIPSAKTIFCCAAMLLRDKDDICTVVFHSVIFNSMGNSVAYLTCDCAWTDVSTRWWRPPTRRGWTETGTSDGSTPSSSLSVLWVCSLPWQVVRESQYSSLYTFILLLHTMTGSERV